MNTLDKLRYAIGFMIINFLGMGVLPNLISDYAKTYYVAAFSAVVLLVVFQLLLELVARRATERARSGLVMVQSEKFLPRRGLIVFSSPGSRTTAAENAIRAHLPKLEHCWIIAGPDRPWTKPHSRDNAKQIIEKYQSLKPAIRFYPKEVDDEHDSEKMFHLIQSTYHEALSFGLRENDIIADYTGGTASMTAGMVLACSASEERDTQYMKPKDITPTGIAAPTAEATPMLVDLRFGIRH